MQEGRWVGQWWREEVGRNPMAQAWVSRVVRWDSWGRESVAREPMAHYISGPPGQPSGVVRKGDSDKELVAE
jgi:hypothetical protein